MSRWFLVKEVIMPIRIPDDLPASSILKSENIFTMSESRASHQNIRPLRVLILNLMPKKIETETQLMRLLSNTPLQVDIELLRVDARATKNTPQKHLDNFYGDFERVKDQKWDGFIVTGAPLGTIPFENVYYWEKFTEIAQAALKVLYDLDKVTRDDKLSGIYAHQTHHHHHPLVRGFDDEFWAPLSRYAEFNSQEIKDKTDLTVFADAPDAGMYLAASPDCRQVFITGHPEYDASTLKNEYLRDIEEGLEPIQPVNYYPNNDEKETPRAIWRSHGNLLYSNWLNYCVYQVTPYDLTELT